MSAWAESQHASRAAARLRNLLRENDITEPTRRLLEQQIARFEQMADDARWEYDSDPSNQGDGE